MKQPLNYTPDNNEVARIVNKIWCQDGKAWNTRIWEHIDQLKQSIMTAVSDAVVVGTPVDELSKTISQDFNVGFYNARRLARTEMSHIYNEASLDRYKDADVKYYMWIAGDASKELYNRMTIRGKVYRQDVKVCELCSELDG